MVSKFLSLLSLFLLLGVCGAQTGDPGCSWTDYADNCDDVQCPPDTREVTTGKSGTCPTSAAVEICKKGQRKLCCNNISTHQLQTCEWVGKGPDCTLDCPNGKTEIATDTFGPGDGNVCHYGCKHFCCDLNQGTDAEKL